MDALQLLIIAIVQGLTEFLPVSSSGHLILIPFFMDFPDQGLLIDVAVHVATLAAIIVYFFRDCVGLARGGLATIGVGRNAPGTSDHQRRFLMIVVGTVPAVVVGFLFMQYGVTDALRSKNVVGAMLIIYGLLLFAADRLGKSERTFEDLTFRDAILVGCAQALALVPGTSRSGVTMTAARALGFARVESARLSFLLSIPAVAGAGLLVGLDIADADPALQRDALIAGAMTFVAAILAMAFLMRWLERATMTVFVLYRVALGIIVLAL